MNIEKIYNHDFDVKNYFDFPSCMVAFAYSLKNSKLFIVDKKIFFRKRNLHLTLMTYFCDSKYLRTAMDKLIADGYKIKVLNWVDKDMECFEKVRYDYEYSVDREYDFDFMWKSSKSRGRLKNKIRHSENRYNISDVGDYDQFVELFDKWYAAAKDRHYMVIKGHYLKYAKRYFDGLSKNTKMAGFFDNDTGMLCGVSSWEVYNGMAQITLMKHMVGDNNLPVYLWWKTLAIILIGTGIEKVFCGSTADKLKQSLGMRKDIAFKIKV
jgi:hypothetical protein